MRIALILILSFAHLFGQNNTREEDVLEDTLIQPQSMKSDTNVRISQVISTPAIQTTLIENQKKIKFYGEVSIGNIWHLYDDPFPVELLWHYTYRVGFGICGGVAVNLKKPFRLRTGLRLSQSGNKINISGDFDHIDYVHDTIGEIDDWIPIDTVFVHRKGYFKLTQYFISIPIYMDIFLREIPVYIINGFEPGYVIFASSSGELFDNDKKWPESEEVNKSYYKNFNFVINNGISFQFNQKKKYNSELQLLFSWGLFHINDPEQWGVNFKTREISLRYLLLM